MVMGLGGRFAAAGAGVDDPVEGVPTPAFPSFAAMALARAIMSSL